MHIPNLLVILWLIMSLVSLAVDGACFWLIQNGPAPLPGDSALNYIAIFLVSAPAPFILAILVVALSLVLGILRGIGSVGRHAIHYCEHSIFDRAAAHR